MMTKEIWNSWLNNWNWILESGRKKGWDIEQELKIKKPVSLKEVKELERELNIILPKEFIEVLTSFSSGVSFKWYLEWSEGQGAPGIYDRILSGGDNPLWDFELLKEMKKSYDGVFKEYFPNQNKGWFNKTIFIDGIIKGDKIGFDVKNGNENCPVIYLGRYWDNFHGKRIGENFIDFMNRWSNIGCPGPDAFQIEPFYDNKINNILRSGEIIQNWKNWINK